MGIQRSGYFHYRAFYLNTKIFFTNCLNPEVQFYYSIICFTLLINISHIAFLQIPSQRRSSEINLQQHPLRCASPREVTIPRRTRSVAKCFLPHFHLRQSTINQVYIFNPCHAMRRRDMNSRGELSSFHESCQKINKI